MKCDTRTRTCDCCGDAYTFRAGKSPFMCDPCYKTGCFPALDGCRAAGERQSRRDKKNAELTPENTEQSGIHHHE